MSLLDAVSVALCVAGAVFFFAGSVGLLRFPDVYTRLHALTKADNLGLGLTAAGLALRADSPLVALKLLLTWLLVLLAGATASHLVAGAAEAAGVEPWSRP